MNVLPTHYEVLGVDRDASHDEVKEAFTALSLRWHPDRHGGASEDDQKLAAFRIQEINEAWRILRNPAARAAYDRSLGSSTDAVLQRRGESATANLARRAEPERPRATGVAGSAGQRSRVPWGWVLALVGGSVLAVAIVAQLSPGSDEVEVQTREGFVEGACVRILSDDTIGEVPCELDHDAVVVGTVPVPRPCPRGTISFVRFEQPTRTGEPQQVCLQRRDQ